MGGWEDGRKEQPVAEYLKNRQVQSSNFQIKKKIKEIPYQGVEPCARRLTNFEMMKATDVTDTPVRIAVKRDEILLETKNH